MLVQLAALLVGAVGVISHQLRGAADSPPPAKGRADEDRRRLMFTDADIASVANWWERLFGGTVTVTDRARERKVSMAILAPSKDELRKVFVAELRKRGIFVIERTGGVLFDTESETKQSK